MSITQSKILICDNDPATHEALTPLLTAAELSVCSVYDGKTALEELHEKEYQLVILETMLPDVSGIEICREIREFSSIPILFLSIRVREFDRLLGFEMGGDDYVCKPFSAREVVFRVKKLLSRQPSSDQLQQLSFCNLTVDKEAMTVRVEEQLLDVTPKEILLFYYLAANAGKVLSRDQILKAVWGYDYYGESRSVDSVVKRIRKKLPPQATFEIQSVYGVGYRLTAKALQEHF